MSAARHNSVSRLALKCASWQPFFGLESLGLEAINKGGSQFSPTAEEDAYGAAIASYTLEF